MKNFNLEQKQKQEQEQQEQQEQEMEPTVWLKKIAKEYKLKKFPFDDYKQSCLIYSKGDYGIFLLERNDGERFTVKVKNNLYLDYESEISLYIKYFASHIPNLLHVENIYSGENPFSKNLFKTPKKLDITCKDVKEPEKIFIEKFYSYYLTKACYFNLGYYFGPKNKGELTYNAFVGFSFQLLLFKLCIVWVFGIEILNQQIY